MVAYTQQTWADGAIGNTPLNAARLTHMEAGIKAVADATTAVEAQIGGLATEAEMTSAVNTAVSNLLNGAPTALDTLDELAAAMGDDANFAATMTAALANRFTKAESDLRYYTQAQVDAAIAAGEGGVAGVSSVNGETGIVILDAADVGARPDTYVPAWVDVQSKPTVFPPDTHTHDDRYYTETETDNLLLGKSATGHHHPTSEIDGFTAAVDAAVQALVGGAPGALDTLNELAAAIGDDANFAATVTSALNARYTKTEADALLDDKAPTVHNHAAADVTTGQFDAARIPTLPQSKITNLATDLGNKANSVDLAEVATSGLASDLSDLLSAVLGVATGNIPGIRLMVGVTYDSVAGAWPTLPGGIATNGSVVRYFMGSDDADPPTAGVTGVDIWTHEAGA